MEPSEFQGHVGRDWRDSEPWWPEPDRPPAGAPNVVLIVLDDVGFAQLGCFGSDLDTPNIDRLAAGGLRYGRFHTTALCSPTRACLLTGRNHHSVGMGRITDLARGYPGYSGRIPKSAGFMSEILRDQGYATWAVGKWHLTPDDEAHLAGSRARWPLGRGFERFYGWFHGETHQFAPDLVHDSHFVEPPTTFEDGYHLTEDLADRAIEFVTDLRNVDPDKPFFCYLATGACHSPHQAPADWIARYRGRFDQGWDAWREATYRRQRELGIIPPDAELSPRADWIPAWDSLSADEQRLAARFMECFAAFLAHADHQIGRVVEHLRTIGELDRTLIVLVSDNGASSEGGPSGSINDVRQWNMMPASVEEMLGRIDEIGGPTIHNNYPWGWTTAGNTPFRRWKREVHEGGISDPCIVHWPDRITDAGGIRRQYTHAIDVLPTVLEVVGITQPAEIDGVPQRPLEGTSFAYTFDDPDAPERHDTQYSEMLGSRAIYHRGWKAVTYKPLGRQYTDEDPDLPFDQDRWELFHVATDFAECHDLAAQEPGKLRELQDLWWREAERYQVLPLDNRAGVAIAEPPPTGLRPRTRYEYRPGGAMVPEAVAVDVKRRSHTITAEVEIPDGGAEGVLLAMGAILGGYSLYVQDGRLQYVHNLVGRHEDHLAAPEPLTPGPHTLGVNYRCDDPFGGGHASLTVDGAVVAETAIRRFTPVRFSIMGTGLTCGAGGPSEVTPRYRGAFPFTGTLHRVVVDVDPDSRPVDFDAEVRAALNAD
jgi:arylsulfatase A-like enzyme